MATDTKAGKTPATPETEGVSRRNLFHILGAAPVAAALTGGSMAMAAGHMQATGMNPNSTEAEAAAGTYKRKVFNDEQWQMVRVLCDMIIPADERSGAATSAGVPEFIDDWIDFRHQQDGNEDLLAEVFGGLIWVNRQAVVKFQKNFVELTAEEQKQILDRIAWPAKAAEEDKQGVLFFNRFRDLTVGGFYSSKVGVADLPYLGNTVVTDWKGCDPKVWAIIEERLKNGYKGAFANTMAT